MLLPGDRLANPALVVVDMQNDFVRAGAPLELPVAYTKFITWPVPTLLWEWSPQCRPPTKCCWKGHRRFYPDVGRELDCTEIIEEITRPATSSEGDAHHDATTARSVPGGSPERRCLAGGHGHL